MYIIRPFFFALLILLSEPGFGETAYIAGTSAFARFYVKALKGACYSGNFKVYSLKQNDNPDTTSGQLGSIFTVKCLPYFENMNNPNQISEVAFNLLGEERALFNSAASKSPLRYIRLSNINPVGVGVVGSGVLQGTEITQVDWDQSTPYYAVPEGGFMLVEPEAFNAEGINYADYEAAAALVTRASVSTAFGVAVSDALFIELQRVQGLLSGACLSLMNSNLPECQPTISRAQYASITNGVYNSAKASIASLFGVRDAKLTVCTTPDHTGVKAAANQYFLNHVSGRSDVGGFEVSAGSNFGSGVLPSYEFRISSSYFSMQGCLNSTGYRIGVLPVLSSYASVRTGYKFVKLGRVEVFGPPFTGNSDVVAPSVYNGEYDFVYRAYKFTTYGPGTSSFIEHFDYHLGYFASERHSGLLSDDDYDYDRAAGVTTPLLKNR